jgi:hypothetical protein
VNTGGPTGGEGERSLVERSGQLGRVHQSPADISAVYIWQEPRLGRDVLSVGDRVVNGGDTTEAGDDLEVWIRQQTRIESLQERSSARRSTSWWAARVLHSDTDEREGRKHLKKKDILGTWAGGRAVAVAILYRCLIRTCQAWVSFHLRAAGF